MKKIFGLLLFTGLIVASCKKESCLDPVANNFDGSGELSRGCLYTGNYIFWMDGATASNLQSNGINEVNIFVEDNMVGELSTANSTPTEPECGATAGLTGSVEMGPINPATMRYRVETLPDGNGDVIVLEIGTYQVVADSCNKIHFVF